ncbi:MAG: TlpA family protein disulfide reductase [Archangium sp.]|nr:TlpA family protein disulfide reductase [Archangium sp.]
MRSMPGLVLAVLIAGCAHTPSGPAPVAGAPLELTVTTYPAKTQFDLKSQRGNVVLLDVWATWCEPCRQSLPLYQGLARTYAAQGLRIFAMNVDGDDAVPVEIPKFIEETKLALPILLDTDAAQSQAKLNVSVMPTAVLIDRAGRVRKIHQGFEGQKSLDELKKDLEALLAESADTNANGESVGENAGGLVGATKRGTLSKRCMQFQEDGDELVLENHLIDSREGSSGARGARGGGCGCN